MELVPHVVVLVRVMAVPMVWMTVGIRVLPMWSVSPLGQCLVHVEPLLAPGEELTSAPHVVMVQAVPV